MKLRHKMLFSLMIGIALLVVAMPVSAQLNKINQGNTVFIGESGLDITNAVDDYTKLAWWAPGLNVSADQPSAIIPISVNTNFEISPDPQKFGGRTGNWYRYNGTPQGLAFIVQNPTGDVAILDLNYSTSLDYQDVTDKSVVFGDFLDFKVKSDLYLIKQERGTGNFEFKIEVTNPGGVKYIKLWTNTTQNDLQFLSLTSNPWYWSTDSSTKPTNHDNGWNTGKLDEYSYPVYAPGIYTVRLVCTQNGLNFQSDARTITIEEEKPEITVSPSSLIRGNKFSTTVKGIPNTYYIIWIKDCVACPNGCCDDPMKGPCCYQPPKIVKDQEGVTFDTITFEQDRININKTLVMWCGCLCTKTLSGIVPPDDGPDNNKNYYYALVKLNETGWRTVEWQTTTCTAPSTYKIHTQRWEEKDVYEIDLERPYAEACVNVQRGVVTINTEVCDQPTSESYLGETVRIYGTNTDSRTTYLILKGPCQSCVGEDMNATHPVENGNITTFTNVRVNSDGTWQYYWYTRNLAIDLGDYTIYAASMPNDTPSLEGVPCTECSSVNPSCAAWAKAPFTFLEPELTGTISPKVLKIVCCTPPKITVSGKATGLRGEAIGQQYETVPIGIWIFGENKVAGQKYIFKTVKPECSTGEFSRDLTEYMNTLDLQPGTYTVILQHPMYNHRLDIIPEDEIYEQPQWYYWWKAFFSSPYYVKETYYPDVNKKYVVTASPVRWSKLFVIDGPDRLAGTAALNALLNGFNDPNIDDKIQVLTFKVESNTALQADFSGTPTSGPAPLSVQFTDISVGSPSTWEWSFGDGYTSNEENPLHVYESPGTYAVTLTITGVSGTSSTTKNNYITVTAGPTWTGTPTPTPTMPPASTMTLYSGWNFISTPRVLAEGHNTVADVFIGVVDTGGRSIFLYDAGSGSWQQMMASSQVKPLDGIWIYSTATVNVPLTYRNDPLATPPTKDLAAGWNAIGFSDVNGASAKDTLTSVKNQWTQVIGYNAQSQAYETSLINGGSGSHSDTNPMYPFKGYWLFMNAPGTLAAISA